MVSLFDNGTESIELFEEDAVYPPPSPFSQLSLSTKSSGTKHQN